MDITGINKAEILQALYNGSKVIGMGIFQATDREVTKEIAQNLLNERPSKSFDYLYGKVMKIDLSSDNLDTFLYNRDIGEGAAERIINAIR